MKRIENFALKAIVYMNRNAAAFLLILLVSAGTARELVATGLTLSGKRVTAIEDNLAGNSQTTLATQYAVQQAITALSVTGANPGEIYNVKSYGAVANAVVPASGNVVTGTNNATAFNNAIAAAPSNATVLIPSGNYLCSTPLTEITTKRLNIVILGNVYTNGASFLSFGGPGGADRQHTVVILGSLVGRVNMPSHTKATFDAGTGPVWSTFTGAAITLNNNVNSMHVKANLIEGFESGILISTGGGNGDQENTFALQKLYKNRYGIHLKSTDGVSWDDKNIFTGFDGGHLRITGDVALKIDGWDGNASTNGEQYNGAFRSDEFYFLAEGVNRVMEANADCTEPKFDITIEGGTNTGVFDLPAIQCRIAFPNYVRAPKWEGQGVLGSQWMVNGMGIDGTIHMPIWLGPGSLAYIGNMAKIDGAGNINVQVRSTLAKSTRDALPSNIRCVNEAVPKTFRIITATTGSNATTDVGGHIRLDNASMNFTAINASTNVGVEFDLTNINASTATISGVTNLTSLAQNKGAHITCDGTTFRAVNNP